MLTSPGIQSYLCHSPGLKPHLQIHSLRKSQVQTTGTRPRSGPPISCTKGASGDQIHNIASL